MARPQKNGLDYFPHDTDSSSDEKIEALMMLYGSKGYTFYFVLLERIYRTSNFELDISDTETIQILSRKMSITTEEFEQILKSAIKHKCFDVEKYQEEQVLTSSGIKKRAGVVVEKREKMRIVYENRKKEISDAETREETAPETPQSKGKKSKENIYTPEFEKFYSQYPRSEEKQRTFKNWGAAIKDCTAEELIQAAKNYKEAVKTREKEYIKTSANFLGRDKVYKDYISKPTEKTVKREIIVEEVAR
jgi:hypothetical protein